MIQIQNVHKSFGNIQALKGISLEIAEGELFGFIGPDGAGKTTLFRVLVSLLVPDEGKATVMDLDVVNDYKKLRTQLGYMPGRFSLYQDLTVEENLNFFAGIFKTTLKENYELIKPIYQQIEPFKKRRAGALSGGMKQKLALSCALIHKPKVLFLDEPTTGVDAVSRKEFWEMLQSLKKQGITIVVSTPYMEEAALCDRIALIQKGELLDIDKPQNIINRYSHFLYGIKAERMYDLVKILRENTHCNSAYLFGEYVHFSSNTELDMDKLKAELISTGMENVEVISLQANIEDSFMDLMAKTNNQA
ncbi:MAG: ABC transporter ATP-binding protein [Bacteroidales bacterium]|jgi:ABC-2 type transport system ATP-binding protein|nr:ABC transporter ATP-binding protein [Bacteroidales bacterium]